MRKQYNLIPIGTGHILYIEPWTNIMRCELSKFPSKTGYIFYTSKCI